MRQIKFPVFKLRDIGILLLILSVTSITGAAPNSGEDQWRSGEDPENLTKLEQVGLIHPALPKTKLLSAQDSIFEIEHDSKPGDEVTGRVNLANNSFEQAKFCITGGSGKGIFVIETFENSRGKSFGVIKLASTDHSEDTYSLKVKAAFATGATDEEEYRIDFVSEPIAKRFFSFVERWIGGQGRLATNVSDDDIELWLEKMMQNGEYTDLPLSTNKDGWEHNCAAAERLLAMSIAYLDQNSRFQKDDELKANLYRGIVRNAEQNGLFRTNWAETHVWRNSDFIAGIGFRFFDILRDEMKREVGQNTRLATQAYDAILDVCDVMWAERMHERPAIGNANRNHRMRSLITRAALSLDPNRALTDEEVWYDTVDRRIPGYYPNGALGDVIELIETGYVMMDTYNNRNGFFPDGTICHHPAVGIQFTADAYGWAWLVENSIPMANFFKNTRYRVKNETYDIIADRLLDAYRPLTFNGYLDMAVGGLSPDRSKWGPRIHEAVEGLLNAKSNDTVIKREEELHTFLTVLEGDGFVDELTLNQPFWNIDYLVHRRPDYFASVKMISFRSRGLERGVNKVSNYYLGDGALFVRVNGDDYNSLENVYNWHAIPGTTAEQRNDKLPLDARSAFPGANGTNTFAGVVSDGAFGFGAFVYERNHADENVNYSTVNANKAYFFFEDEILAMGNSIRRVRPGDKQPILTTLDQKSWKSDIVYGMGGNRKTLSLKGKDQSLQLRNIESPVWFHHDQVGYVIVPENSPVDVDLKAASTDKKKKIFQLAIDHGTHPESDGYRYFILPATSINAVEQFVDALGGSPSVIVLRNDQQCMAVINPPLRIAQIAFYKAGSVKLDAGANSPIHLSVDRPALVMLRETKDGFIISVTDPHHSVNNTTINVSIDRPLTGPGSSFDSSTEVSTISFNHSSEEVLAGKPITATFLFANTSR